MGRIADLRRRAQRNTSNLYDTLFTRRVSIYLTAALYPLGVSANAVSLVNCVVAAGACLAIAFGSGWLLFAGVAGVHLFAVLDSVDGELARLRGTFSIKGLFLEDLAAYTMISGVFLAVASYLVQTTDLGWPLWLAIVTVAFGRNGMQVARRAILKSIATRRPVSPELLERVVREGPPPPVSGVRRVIEKHLLHFTNVWIVLTSLIVVEQIIATDRHLVLPVFTFYSVTVLLKELAVIATFVFTDALDRQLLAVYKQASTVPTAPVPGLDLAGD